MQADQDSSKQAGVKQSTKVDQSIIKIIMHGHMHDIACSYT